MKSLRLFLIALCLGTVTLVHAGEATKNTKIEQLFAATKMDRLLGQSLTLAANQVKSAAFQQLMGVKLTPAQQKISDEMQDKMMNLITTTLSWQQLEPMYVKLYAQAFTEEEIDGALAFYNSAAGKAMVDKTPQLMQDANQTVQQRMLQMQPQMQALIKEYTDKLKTSESSNH